MQTGPGDRPTPRKARVPKVKKTPAVPQRPLVLAPKPKPVGVFKHPTASNPMQPAQRTAAQKTGRAERQLPQRPLPAVPHLQHPTAAQDSKTIALYHRSLHRGGTDAQEAARDPRNADAIHQYTAARARQQARARSQAVQELVDNGSTPSRAAKVVADQIAQAKPYAGKKTTVGIGPASVNVAPFADALLKHTSLGAASAENEFFKKGGPAPFALKAASNVPKDAAELVTTTPTSLVKLGDTALHHPGQVPGLLAAPYKDFVKDPGRFIENHPVSAALMFAPAVRAPGRIVGKGLRLAGKQTLERAPKTLPGTALTEPRVASRDALVNFLQKRHDAKHPDQVMSKKAVQERVDRFYGWAQQHRSQIKTRTVETVHRKYQHLPEADRKLIVADRVERARKAADRQVQKRFGEEFGANARPSSGAAERDAAGAVREQANRNVKVAKQRVKVAQADHQSAMVNARLAVAKAKRSPRLAALEKEQRAALADVARAKRAHGQARVEMGVAKGRQQVLRRNIGGGMAGGRGVDVAGEGITATADQVRAARAASRAADQAVQVERARLKGVPPAEHDALIRTMHDEAQARTALGDSRVEKAQARGEHIAAKQALTNATLIDPAQTGRLFASKADARAVIKRLPVDAEGEPTFKIQDAGGQYAVVPKVAAKRLMKQTKVGTAKAPIAIALRRGRRALTQAVLPVSPKWLVGQAGEAGLRAAVAGAGPLDWLRMSKIVKDLNAQKAGEGDALLHRVTGTHLGLSGPARQYADGSRSMADDFVDTGLERPANAASRAAATPPLRAARAGWRWYSNAVMGSVNGVFERTATKAMAGQAVKNTLLDRSIIGLSDKAIQDAARGLRGTESQVQLAKNVERMYGKYKDFSPFKREIIMHWTPFLPWYLNVVTFLTKTLPVDHPMQAALIADANAATEQWRKANHMSLLDPAHRPDWMLGGFPSKGGVIPVGHFTPWGAGADPAQTIADLTGPQFMGPLQNLAGVDWKWQQLKDPGYKGKPFNVGSKVLRAGLTAAESLIPVVAPAAKYSGLDARANHKAEHAGVPLKQMINPLAPAKNTVKKVKVRKARSSGGDILGGGSGSSGDILK